MERRRNSVGKSRKSFSKAAPGELKRYSGVALCVLLAGFVSTNAMGASDAVAPVPPALVSGARAAAVQKVEFDVNTGKLWVEAADADLGELLGTIAQKSAVTIELGAGISKKVTVSFAGLPLEQGINTIVAAAGEGNLAAEYTKRPGEGPGTFLLEKIVLLRKGQAAAAAGKNHGKPGGNAAGSAGGGVSSGQDPGALGELLRRYQDPKTTREERLKLRQSIRRSARIPEEKAQLKKAVLDPRNRGRVAEDLQFALAQTMREHPEGSDQAYVIELMRREPAPGPLARAMVGGGDPAYVNYLLSAAQRKDLRAIQLTGNLRIRQAVPVLEKLAAAPDAGSPVSQAAAAALRQLGVAPADREGSLESHEERFNR